MSWACVWVERTGEAQVSLRRYSRDEVGCPGGGIYHNATAPISNEPLRLNERGHIEGLPLDDYADRPEWPTACSCGHVFTEADDRQVNQDPIYRAVFPDGSTGKEWPARSLPVGAMLDTPWQKPFGVGPDGIALTVVLPPEPESGDSRGHWWHVDGPSRNNGVPGPGWTRTGDPRNPPSLTVTPSILTGDYHGFLQGGVLTDPL